jgi:hypothetical protein
VLLGHANPALLHSHFNEIVTPEMVIFFEIIPAVVNNARQAADAAAKEAAEKLSDCGLAEKVNGIWQPVKRSINVNIEPSPFMIFKPKYGF